VVEYQVKRLCLAQSHHLQPLLLVRELETSFNS